MLRTPGRFLSLAATLIAVAPTIVLADTATTPPITRRPRQLNTRHIPSRTAHPILR